jgi:hypothetical protein
MDKNASKKDEYDAPTKHNIIAKKECLLNKRVPKVILFYLSLLLI